MDDDWESENFVPLPPTIAREQPKGQWDDEDAAEEEDVKESWEDEEKPKPKPVKPEAPHKPKAEKKGVTFEVKNEEPKKPLTPEEEAASILEEKLRQQRLVEESDYQSTTELFGKTRDEDHTLENFIPKSETDFNEYADLLAQKLRPYEKSFHYLTFLKAFMRHAMMSLKAVDAKEVASSVSIIANEKLKTEKEATGKRKTGPKKKQLHVEKQDEDAVLAPFDDVDDYDFM